jgi:hypothetical protein
MPRKESEGRESRGVSRKANEGIMFDSPLPMARF